MVSNKHSQIHQIPEGTVGTDPHRQGCLTEFRPCQLSEHTVKWAQYLSSQILNNAAGHMYVKVCNSLNMTP